MDHSVQAYIKRLPTEALEEFLQQCRQDQREEDYAYIIPDILDVLTQRKTLDSIKD